MNRHTAQALTLAACAQVGPGYVSLQEPVLDALEPVIGRQMAPEQLLLVLSSKGLHLLPEDRDAQFTGGEGLIVLRA